MQEIFGAVGVYRQFQGARRRPTLTQLWSISEDRLLTVRIYGTCHQCRSAMPPISSSHALCPLLGVV